MLSDAPPLRVGQEELVDSVIVDATIYNPGGSHLGAFPGPLFSAFRHVGQLLAAYERETNRVVPRRGIIHDAGSNVSHKRIICLKRYVEGKSSDQIARETYHSIEAVDRYLGQFDRVRHGRSQRLSIIETAHILNCSVSLVKAYRKIDKELEGKDA